MILYVKLSTALNFIHICRWSFHTNTLFQWSQPHLPWVFYSCALETCAACSLQRSPKCSFFRVQLCARAVWGLCNKRKYLSVALASSRSQKFTKTLLVSYPGFVSHKSTLFCNNRSRRKNFRTLTWWFWRLVKNFLLQFLEEKKNCFMYLQYSTLQRFQHIILKLASSYILYEDHVF